MKLLITENYVNFALLFKTIILISSLREDIHIHVCRLLMKS